MKTPDLLEKVRDPENTDLRMLAAHGLLPLPPARILPLQVELAASSEHELAEAATRSLAEVEPVWLAGFLREEAGKDELVYFAASSSHPLVLEAILRRRDTPAELLAEMAPRLSEDLQEVLVLRQDAITEYPALLEALESNPGLSRHVARRLAEYRDLMRRPEKGAPEAEAVELVTAERLPQEGGPEAEIVTEAGWWEELAAVEAEEVADEAEARERAEKVLEEEEEGTGSLRGERDLTEAQIRSLPIPDRLKLTRGASKGLRGILIKDPNPMVALAVLENNTLSDQEVESVARNRSANDDVLQAIARNRGWMRKYPVVQALTTNPKTPLHITLKLLPQLTPKDLKGLLKDRNIPEAVRSQARRLHTARTS